jgi:hypothetical protein
MKLILVKGLMPGKGLKKLVLVKGLIHGKGQKN